MAWRSVGTRTSASITITNAVSLDKTFLIHWSRTTLTCVSKQGHHWFGYWPVACLALSHYLNQCWLLSSQLDKMNLTMSPAKWRSFCVGLNKLRYYYRSEHSKPRIVMLPTLPSLLVSQVVVTMTCGVANNDKVGIITTLGVQWRRGLLDYNPVTTTSVLYYILVIPADAPCILNKIKKNKRFLSQFETTPR